MNEQNKLVLGAVLRFPSFNTNANFLEIITQLDDKLVSILCELIEDSCSVSTANIQIHEPTLDYSVEQIQEYLCDIGMVTEFTDTEIRNELVIHTTNFLTYLKRFLEDKKCNLTLTDVSQCYTFGVGTFLVMFSKSPTEDIFL